MRKNKQVRKAKAEKLLSCKELKQVAAGRTVLSFVELRNQHQRGTPTDPHDR